MNHVSIPKNIQSILQLKWYPFSKQSSGLIALTHPTSSALSVYYVMRSTVALSSHYPLSIADSADFAHVISAIDIPGPWPATKLNTALISALMAELVKRILKKYGRV